PRPARVRTAHPPRRPCGGGQAGVRPAEAIRDAMPAGPTSRCGKQLIPRASGCTCSSGPACARAPSPVPPLPPLPAAPHSSPSAVAGSLSLICPPVHSLCRFVAGRGGSGGGRPGFGPGGVGLRLIPPQLVQAASLVAALAKIRLGPGPLQQPAGHHTPLVGG